MPCAQAVQATQAAAGAGHACVLLLCGMPCSPPAVPDSLELGAKEAQHGGAAKAIDQAGEQLQRVAPKEGGGCGTGQQGARRPSQMVHVFTRARAWAGEGSRRPNP